MQWAAVYIREAHASDVWPLKFSFEQPQPSDLAERAQYARRASADLGFAAAGIETLCDGMDDAFNTAFGAWPTAYYLLDERGTLLTVGEAADGEYSFPVRKFVDAVSAAARRIR